MVLAVEIESNGQEEEAGPLDQVGSPGFVFLHLYCAHKPLGHLFKMQTLIQEVWVWPQPLHF